MMISRRLSFPEIQVMFYFLIHNLRSHVQINKNREKERRRKKKGKNKNETEKRKKTKGKEITQVMSWKHRI